MRDKIKLDLREHRSVLTQLVDDEKNVDKIETITKKVIESYRMGGKLVLFGNGGSASDAQHISAELVSKLKFERPMLNSMALNVNTSILTAIGNDYSYDDVFSKQIENLVDHKDVVIGLTTSGNSKNVIKGLVMAKNRGALTIAFTGSGGGKVKEIVDILMNVPSDNTQRIQEMHITIGHIMCEIVEHELFAKKN